MSQIEDALLIDVLHQGDFGKAPSGDLALAKGKKNLEQWVLHCLLTVPGTLVHRPLFGIGVKEFQGRVTTIQAQRELALKIREGLELDDRIESVNGVQVVQDEVQPGLFSVLIKYTARGVGEIIQSVDPFEAVI